MNEELKKIYFYQKSGVFHPLICGNDSRHRPLVAVIRKSPIPKLECLDCDYVQNTIPPIPSIEEIKRAGIFDNEQKEITIVGSMIIVLNEEDKILIAKRAPFRKDLTPNVGACRWSFIGGKVKNGEKEVVAAQREIKEEIGITVLKSDIYFIKKSINEWDFSFDPFVSSLFICRINKSQEENIVLNNEHTEYKFIDIEDFNKYNIIGFEKKEVINEIKEFFDKKTIE